MTDDQFDQLDDAQAFELWAEAVWLLPRATFNASGESTVLLEFYERSGHEVLCSVAVPQWQTPKGLALSDGERPCDVVARIAEYGL